MAKLEEISPDKKTGEVSGLETISALSRRFEWKRTSPQFWLLIDPDRVESAGEIAEIAEQSGVDIILVGSSLLVERPVEEVIDQVRNASKLPVIIFPGGGGQVSSKADAILFLVFLSSRNPRWLVEEQVLAAHKVKRAKLAVIPTAYLLIESGTRTSVEFFSNSLPIPRNKPDIAVAHALAGQFMGMNAVFLEAGSGAAEPVPPEMVKSVADSTDLFLIVGGGIRTPEQAEERARWADAVVVGNFFEGEGNLARLREFVEAVHSAR